MNVPHDLRYTDQHEWVRPEDAAVRVGITDYAQDALGDVVFVEFVALGDTVAVGDVIAEIESTKSVAEVYAPIAGTVAAVNEDLPAAPEKVNSDPYGEGWFAVIEPDEPDDVGSLLDAEAYAALIG